MQTTRIIKIITFGALVFIFASCAKTNTQGKLIPAEASVVITMDGKSLSSKLPWEDIKQNPLFQEMHSDSSMPATVKSLLDNPANSGIDVQSDILFFAVKDSLGTYLGFEGKVKDDAIFKNFNKQVTENGAESEKDGIQFINKFPVCVGWTKEKFVYVVDAQKMSGMDDLSRRMMQDSISVTRTTSARDMGATCKAIFALAENKSLAKNERFTTLMKESGDIHFWLNSEELIKSGPSNPAMAMINLEKFYKGAVTTATMNFENGKMTFNATSYASGELIDLFKKYSGGKINEDMIKHMPGKDIVGLMAFNFKPEALDELLKMTGMDGAVNIPLKNFGFTWQDFIKANKGDIVFGISDLLMKTDTSSFKFKDQEEHMSIAQKPSFNFIFSTSIGDKESFNKLVNAGKKFGQNFNSDSGKPFVYYNSNANWFVLSNTQQNADQYLSTSNSNVDFVNKISGEPFGGYLNIQLLLKAFSNIATKDSSAKIAYDATLAMWDNVIWKGGNYSNGGIQQTAEINLVDKSTNSLKQLNQYAAKLSELYKDQRKKQKEATMAFEDFQNPADTTAIPVPKK